MAQGGLHRGVAVCGGSPGPSVTQPSPGLMCTPLPQPTAPCVLHRYIMGLGYRPIRRPSGLGATTMAFGQGRDVTGGYRSCPAMQCGASVTSGLTATRPAAPGGLPGPELGGGGIKGRQRRGGGKGQNLPLRCSVRRGNGTCLLPLRLVPQEVL